ETVSRMLERSYSFTLVFMLIFILSHTFALAEVKAANSAVYVLTLLVMALYLKDSDSRIGREAALILIAAAAGFKVAPAIFGFLYIKEKRYKEAARLVVYGIVFFFAPFAMFGGIEGIKNFLNITGQVSSAAIPRPETIGGVIIELFSVLGLGEEMGLKVGRIICFGYLAICMYLFFKRKYSWKTLFLISSLMVIFVNLSYPYTLQYFLLPLIAFIKETKTNYNKLDYTYAVLFALVLTTYPFIRIDLPTATFITNYFWVYLFVFTILIDVTKNNNSKLGEKCD
ncbi:MAG: glycosyltransferase 87 family protein, partial [Lachnospiraceae bacterium]|nr:glycosyltransferase 87 family protein [Lachnospiraceae bacterium]